MFDENLLNLIIVPIVGALIWYGKALMSLIKEQRQDRNTQMDKLSNSLNKLAESVAYCPTRRKIEKEIKGGNSFRPVSQEA